MQLHNICCWCEVESLHTELDCKTWNASCRKVEVGYGLDGELPFLESFWVVESYCLAFDLEEGVLMVCGDLHDDFGQSGHNSCLQMEAEVVEAV